MWGCSRGETSPRSEPKAAPGVPYNDCQRPTTRPHRSRCCRDASRWRLDASRWRPGRPREWIWALNLAKTVGFMVFWPKLVPKQWVLWFFGPERSQEPPPCADGPKKGLAGRPQNNHSQWGRDCSRGCQNSGFYRFWGPRRSREPKKQWVL